MNRRDTPEANEPISPSSSAWLVLWQFFLAVVHHMFNTYFPMVSQQDRHEHTLDMFGKMWMNESTRQAMLVWAQEPDEEEKNRLGGLFFTASKHAWIDKLRKEATKRRGNTELERHLRRELRQERPISDHPQPGPRYPVTTEPDEPQQQFEVNHDIDAALQVLVEKGGISEEAIMVYFLREVEGWQPKEIRQILGLKRTTYHNRLVEATAAVAQFFQEELGNTS